MRKAILLLIVLSFPMQGREVSWNARAGMPGNASPWWELRQSGRPHPFLQPGKLVIDTSTADLSEKVYYRQALVDFKPPVAIEARMRFVSGPSADGRTPAAAILFTLKGTFGNGVFIGRDHVYVLSSHRTIGASANVDTDNAFHTYLVKVDREGAFTVSQDGRPILTGSSFNWSESDGIGARVAFGDASSEGGGQTEWEYVRHNAYTLSASAGPARPFECTQPVRLGGSGSEGVGLSYEWRLGDRVIGREMNVSESLLPGQYVATLIVTDIYGLSEKASVPFTVVFSEFTPPPQVVAPKDIDVHIGAACELRSDPGKAVGIGGCNGIVPTGTRNDGADMSAPFPLGTTTIVWTAKDPLGRSASKTQRVVVRGDKRTPVIRNVAATPRQLTESRGFVDVTINYEAFDSCGPVTAELEVTSGRPDAQILDDHRLRLRAAVDEPDGGLMYVVTIIVRNVQGNEARYPVRIPIVRARPRR